MKQGVKILVLRAADDAAKTAEKLTALGCAPILSPVLTYRKTDIAFPDQSFDFIVVTSARAFPLKPPSSALASLPLFVVGGKTADMARKSGFSNNCEKARDARALIASLRRALPEGGRGLYLAGRDRKEDLAALLGPTFHLSLIETYVAEAAKSLSESAQKFLASGHNGFALHYSRRSAQIFCDLTLAAGLNAAALDHIAISTDAAAPLMAQKWRVKIAEKPDETAMLACIAV